MREGAFIQKNKHKWIEFEGIIKANGEDDNPERLADLFIQATDDLAYARTYYPESNTVTYLNGLSARVYLMIYKNRKEKRSRYLSFWKYELPLILAESQKQLLYSLLFFLSAVLIGWFSTAYDENFPRLILGDHYVNMTIENIQKNDPMAIYKSQGAPDMFLGISVNNIKVSFYCFVMGILFSAGAIYISVQNGIMLGAFQFFFYKYGLLLDTALTIWIHGTLEISAIIIACGAGIVMGNSLLFPGNYPRLYSLRQGAEKGIKIIIGLVPVFVLAAILESFVTRYTEMPLPLKLFIIFGSLAFILFYFVFFPIYVKKQTMQAIESQVDSLKK